MVSLGFNNTWCKMEFVNDSEKICSANINEGQKV